MEQEERIYKLMMGALDGELSAAAEAELQAYLHAHPAYMREWQALLAIDTLFRQTPALAPAADFTQRTLARLPNRRARIWVIGLIYLMLLVSGVLPLLLAYWAFTRLGPLLTEPALWSSLWQLLEHGLQLGGTLLRAFVNGVGGLVVQQPAVVGWLLVMVGIISLWAGVYQQLTSQPEQISNGG